MSVHKCIATDISFSSAASLQLVCWPYAVCLWKHKFTGIQSLNLGPVCSKLTTSLVNVSLKFQMLISQIHLYFLLKKCVKLLQCKSFSSLL